MGTPLPLNSGLVDQPQKRLVYQSRWLQRMVRPLVAHLVRSNGFQFVVDQRQQVFHRRRVALAQVLQETRGLVAHERTPYLNVAISSSTGLSFAGVKRTVQPSSTPRLGIIRNAMPCCGSPLDQARTKRVTSIS